MNRLLQAERLREGKFEPHHAPVRLREVASDVAAHVASQAAEKGMELHVAVPEEAAVRSDRALIALALQNLVGNAVKYASRGQVRIEAQPLTEERGDAWFLSVSDQGPGIPPEQQKRLFDAFTRGETHGQQGVGLGLSIASQAVSLLGGKLTVRSAPEAGSTFSIVLPTGPRVEPGTPRAPYA